MTKATELFPTLEKGNTKMDKKKSQAELEIEALADVFNIATEGFELFAKEAKETSSGNYSKAASSGDYSKAASSGDSSTAASSGNSSTAASSGYSSTAASSGNSSTAASSGYSSKAASSGDSSTAASSGNSSTAASSGNSSTAASSGYSSKAASSGYSSKAASSGDSSKAASSGNYSKAASSGYYSKAASSGNYSKAASSGDYSKAASSGEFSSCAAVGYRAAVKGGLGNLIMASEYIAKGGKLIPIGGKADLVDGKKIKANCWYIVENAEWVEVDFSDGIFGYVLSTRQNVKKIKTDSGRIQYVASDGENHAHADTMREAIAELAFKVASRDVSQFENMPLNTKKTPDEWAFVYRAITGACQSGARMFMESKGKLKKQYTLTEIIEQTRGAYGHERFVEVVGE